MIAVGELTHYLGDAICLVAAETPEILAQAKALVRMDYEGLPMVCSPREACCPRSMRPTSCWPTSTSRGATRRRPSPNRSIFWRSAFSPPGRNAHF